MVWKLLRQHISVSQLAGFFLANLCGMIIVLLGIQFYRDVLPVFTQGDSFIKKDFVILSKKVSTLGAIVGKSSTFSAGDIAEIEEQPFTKNVGRFLPSQFKVSAGMGMQGIRMSTDMFFESVPDEFVDVKLDKWKFDPSSDVVPIIIPRNYLNLYNFGFAQSRNLPQLSEGVMGMVNLDIRIMGNGQVKQLKGNIVGFSNINWANAAYGTGEKVEPSRLIVEVNNPTDERIAKFFQQKGYETEGNSLDAGKASWFLKVVIGIVLSVGLLISVLSFYILILSIYLLLQKNSTKLENLLLIGYSPARVARPYQLLTIVLNLVVLALGIVAVMVVRSLYLDTVMNLYPDAGSGSVLPAVVTGVIIFIGVSALNILIIRRKINAIWLRK